MVADPEALPDLSSDHLLTPAQIAQFQRDGHILLRGLAARAEVAAYRPLIGALVWAANKHRVPLAERDTYHQAFIQVANL